MIEMDPNDLCKVCNGHICIERDCDKQPLQPSRFAQFVESLTALAQHNVAVYSQCVPISDIAFMQGFKVIESVRVCEPESEPELVLDHLKDEQFYKDSE